jgi:hypothetical protein
MGSLWGSVFGAIFLSLLPEVLHAVKEYNVLVYGFILMVVLMFFPMGLFPAIRSFSVSVIRKRTSTRRLSKSKKTRFWRLGKSPFVLKAWRH